MGLDQVVPLKKTRFNRVFFVWISSLGLAG
jgi:hypothetical protein